MSELPAGVGLKRLVMHGDSRGVFTEVFRREWGVGIEPVQWNVVSSEPGVLRGVHVHPRHDDYLVALSGRIGVGLRDLRAGSPTEGLAGFLELRGDAMTALLIPHGVAHGFYSHEPSIHLYAVSHYWDREDEKCCLWSDPELEIPWPFESAVVSERDAAAPPLRSLLAQLARAPAV